MSGYVDYARYYDFDCQPPTDIPFYLHYAQLIKAPVLELACGTGRILFPLAQQGIDISGIDLSENMLSICREKLKQHSLLNKVKLYHADMSNFNLPFKEFGLIFIAFRSFMHLYTQEDQFACLNCIFNHLMVNGNLIIDFYSPNYKLMSEEPEQPFKVTAEYDLLNGNHVIRSDRFVRNDPKLQIQYSERQFQEYSQTGTLITETTVPINTRYTFYYELKFLLEHCGFKVLNFYKDYNRNQYDGTGEIIVVAKK